jgi:hypothetical protein
MLDAVLQFTVVPGRESHVSRMAGFCRSLVRRSIRAYRVACARDDMATQNLLVPDGVWACDGCNTVLLGAGAPRQHLCTDRPAF